MALSVDEMAVVSIVLRKLEFYDFLRPSERLRLLAGFEKRHLGRGKVVIRQGEPGHIFYILASGSVGVFLRQGLNDRKVATLGPNSFFGEMALIGNEPRSATVICERGGIALTLLRETFRNVIMANPHASLIVQKIAEYRKTANLAGDRAEVRQVKPEGEKDR